MVPQPPVKLYTPSIISTLKNSLQTVGPICKCLFGPSDPRTTSDELREELKKEQRRFKDTWNFDVRQAFSPIEKRSHPVTDKPQSPKRRFVWERQDPKDVPYFYSKPFSSPRAPRANSIDESPVKRRKLHDSMKQVQQVNISPRPLACRDENISPNSLQTISRKRVAPSSRLCIPLFAPTPANFADSRSAPTTARVVSALRIPTPDIQQHNKTANPEQSKNIDASVKASTPSIQTSSPERTSCKKTSRQLFSKRSSPSNSMRSVNQTTQRLITGTNILFLKFSYNYHRP